MPYCLECGMRHDAKQRICSSCGWNIPDKCDGVNLDDKKLGSSESEIPEGKSYPLLGGENHGIER